MRLVETVKEWERLAGAIWDPLPRAVYPKLISNGLIGFEGKSLRCLRCGGYLTIGDERKCLCKGRRRKNVAWVPDGGGALFVWGERR